MSTTTPPDGRSPHAPEAAQPASPAEPPGPGDDVPGLARVDAQRHQLQRVADALSWSLEPHAVARQLVDAACLMLGAPQGWAAVPSDDGREVVLLAWRGYDEAAVRPWLRVPIESAVPLAEAVRLGRPIVHASAADRVLAYPALLQGGAAPVVEASAIVPLIWDGRTTGALAVTFDDVREIPETDRWFLESLAAQGAGALERARLFEAVQERDKRLRLALEASGTWIWEWEVAEDRLTWTPEPPAAIPGLDGAPAASATWGEIVDAGDLPGLAATVERAFQTGEPFEAEFRVAGATGPRWFQASGQATMGPDGRRYRVVGTAHDITERKLDELSRLDRLQAEREAARLREAFIGVVSHELRTPITTIFGGTRVLSRRWRDMPPAARDALLADVSSEADRLYRLVEDLLVLTRVERGRLDVGDEPVALRQIVERVVGSERVRSPDVVFEVRIPPDLPSVQGEDMYVEQVLRNLLSNAAKYGGPGSRVEVRAEIAGDAVTLRVLDEGPGIDEAEADRLFELFYRSPATAPSVAGAGIGLFVCRQLAIAMGGSIGAERRPEGGAAFVLRLNRYADDDLDEDDAG